MARKRTASTRRGATESLRMGPVALFTLVAVICLAVLAVLALSTGQSTLSLAQRRASATTQTYRDETAAQTWLAELDERVQAADGKVDDDAIQAATDAAYGTDTTDVGSLNITTSRDGDAVLASFDVGNGRQLDIRIRYDGEGTLHVEQWRITSVVNDEPAMGNLLGSSL